jgi:hypothetical protein
MGKFCKLKNFFFFFKWEIQKKKILFIGEGRIPVDYLVEGREEKIFLGLTLVNPPHSEELLSAYMTLTIVPVFLGHKCKKFFFFNLNFFSFRAVGCPGLPPLKFQQ